MKDAFGFLDGDARRAVLPRVRAFDLAAEFVREELEAVADAGHRNAELDDPRVHRGRAVVVDARRPAREDDRARIHRPDRVEGNGAGLDLAVDVLLADSSRNQLRVLRPEIEDED